MIKEIISVVMSILLSITSIFTGVYNGGVDKVKVISKSEYEYANEIGSEIVRCLKENDRKGLNYLFCSKVKDTEYLKNQIDFIFDYIDKKEGLIIENGEWQIPYSHGSNDYSGRTVEYLSCKYSKNVKIGEKNYELRFTSYQILKRHKEYEGILTISINEHKDYEMIEKSLEYQEKNQIEKKIIMGFNLRNTDFDTFQSISILPDELNGNKEYELSDSLEDDR